MEELLIQMQQTKQAQETEVRRRRGFVRIAVILLVILILLRIVGIAWPLPAVIAVTGEKPVYAAGPTAVMRVEWLSYCDGAKVGLSAYAANDIPCSPSRVISLPALQEQLVAVGVLMKGEYLTLAATQLSPACRVVVVNGENGQIIGWLCADVNGGGLYRTDAAGQHPGPCWQLWSDGEWQLPQA
jgi:hypothetical protein